MTNKKLFFFSLSILVILFSCDVKFGNEKSERSIYFDFYFDEKRMIINTEQDNSIEGQYLLVNSYNFVNLIKTNIPNDFSINQTNKKEWVIGWGENKAYYDSGCENLREIKNINNRTKKIELGKLLRGSGFPKKGQRIVFWKIISNQFEKYSNRSLLDLKKWKEFSGSSVSFAGINYENKLNRWIMLFQECDTSKKQIYASESNNLFNWTPSNYSKPILTYRQFKKYDWTKKNYSNKQTPIISDVKYINNKWLVVLIGENRNGKRLIGLAISNKSILGPYFIQKKPLFGVETLSDWNKKGYIRAKLAYNQTKKKYLIAFTGVNCENIENVGLAYSSDLINWSISKRNPVIKSHSGWRSKNESSEVDYVSWEGNIVKLVISGTKKLRNGFYSNYILKQNNKTISGNVDDAQLGVYISNNNGNSFLQHQNNPVIINNYADLTENEHMGGFIQFIETDSLTYFFYQAKTSMNGLKYSIYLRTKRKVVSHKVCK